MARLRPWLSSTVQQAQLLREQAPGHSTHSAAHDQQMLNVLHPALPVLASNLLTVLLCFNVLGTNTGPTDRIQHINKHSLICQVDTIDFLSEKHSLRKPPHAFGSELVKKS